MHAPTALYLHLDDTHAADAVMAVLTVVLGGVGLALLAVDSVAAMVFGAVGVVSGLSGQLISRTRAERFADITGLVAAALAFSLGAATGHLTFSG